MTIGAREPGPRSLQRRVARPAGFASGCSDTVTTAMATVGRGRSRAPIWSPTKTSASVEAQVLASRGGRDGGSDVFLIRSQNRVRLVGYLTTGGLPDALTRDSLAAALASGLEGEAATLVDLPTTAGQIDALLPTLDELDNVEVFNTAPFAVSPDGQSPLLSYPIATRTRLLTVGSHRPNGTCASYVDARGHTHRTSVAAGSEYLDSALVVPRRAKLEALDLDVPKEIDSVTDTVLIWSGDYVGLLRYSLTTTDTPNVDTRNSMVEVLVGSI